MKHDAHISKTLTNSRSQKCDGRAYSVITNRSFPIPAELTNIPLRKC